MTPTRGRQGRPRKAPDQRRNKRVITLMTEAEREALYTIANRRGRSLSDLLRDAYLRLIAAHTARPGVDLTGL